MCGIAGILTIGDKSIEPNTLRSMVQAQSHRGPDDSGETFLPFGRGLIGLGHRRLSIIDTSGSGHQPMINPENGDHLIYNGEIYNFKVLRHELEALGVRFIGNSDTEVLLHALSRWGFKALPRLQGMYSLAFYNAFENRLMLARDPLGIKPLYIAYTGECFVFASEVRAILASKIIKPCIDESAMAGMLAYGSVQHPLTMIRGIQSFPPGCYRILTAGSPVQESKCIPFWKFPKPNANISVKQTIDDIRETLDFSVRDHLVADVPVGVFLSSGLDSTIVAGLAAKHAKHLRSFTVGFSDQPDMSEFKEAALTAKALGMEHAEISIAGREAQQAAVEWLNAMDQPSIDGLNTFVISKGIKQQGITVALSGLGGDELFGGYSSFADVPRLYRIMKYMQIVPACLHPIIASLVGIRKPEAVQQKFSDMLATDGSLLALYLQRRRVLSNSMLSDMGFDIDNLKLTGHFLPTESVETIECDDKQPIWSISQMECRHYQANTLLRDTDANSMANGLEIRVPMLDQRMIELMGAVPDAIRLASSRADKRLLRLAFPNLLRPSLLKQNKMGFTLPVRHWMLGPLREKCEQALGYLKSLGILWPEGIDKVWHNFIAEPESPVWSRAFALVVLGAYLEKMNWLK